MLVVRLLRFVRLYLAAKPAPMRRAVTACMWPLLLSHTGGCLADVWAYVDERGVAHFATSQIDSRYQLFARVDETPTAPLTPPTLGSHTPPVGLAVPTSEAKTAQHKKLLALFEKSPDFAGVQSLLRQASKRHEVSYELLQAVMATESGFNRHAVSPKGAVGLMQIMPATAQRFGLKPLPKQSVEQRLFDPALNIETGARYLRYLHTLFPGEPGLVLAAYNAGEGAVARAGNKIPNYPETQQYVRTVLQLQQLLQAPNAGPGLQPPGTNGLKPNMMVPGSVLGRSNMVQGLSSRSGRITLQIPVDGMDDALVK